MVKKTFNNIAVRITASIAVIIASASMVVAWLIPLEEKSVLENELQKRGVYLAEIIAQQIIEPLLYEEKYAMHAILQSSLLSEEGVVVFAEVYDSNGESIVNLKREGFKLPLIDKGKFVGIQSVMLIEDPKLQIYDISIPIIAKGLGPIGFLRLGITKKFLIETLKGIKKKLYSLLSIIVLSGIIVGLWMARKIVKPVLLLNQGVKRIGMGDLGAEVEVIGEGEIKELAIAFNEMSGKLKESIDAIKTAQENLIRTEKLYALGEFSAGLAHEIKNPLTSIKMLIQTAKDKHYDIKPKDIKIIEDEINRIDDIVKDFLAFARPAKTKFISTNVNVILKEVLSLIRPKMEQSNINLVERLDCNLPEVNANSDGLKQIFLNIILNAIQAMGKRGTLNVASFANNGAVTVCIHDTGHGIPHEIFNRIFDPFFTTKEDGTGMGLAIAYNIVREHKGDIYIDSVLNEGTKVSIILPLTDDKAQPVNSQ